ncbi:DUF6261 family protein [uncultured Parabacteroides sp.]|uniref:DUF6261 family protein n=1 Tax=uncultured Parabacteroides sp. TaxID=512312 RepID=UPI0025EF0210|nr:DUF6261 family protein [uncultured Parabacteroides sp.]
MPTEIQLLDTTRLHQAEDYSFHTLAIEEFKKCPEAKIKLVFDSYKDKYKLFDEALKISGGKDPLTKEVTDSDAATDNCYIGLAAITRAQLYHYEPLIAELARQAVIIFDRYGNPTQLNYLEEYGIIDNILQDFETFDHTEITVEGSESGGEEERPGELDLNPQNLQKLGIKGWCEHLKLCRDRFMAAFTKRNAVQGTVVTGVTKAARVDADTAYRALVKRINALVEIDGDTEYLEAIQSINRLIDRQKTILATRKTLNAKKTAKKEEGGGGKPDDERPGEL